MNSDGYYSASCFKHLAKLHFNLGIDRKSAVCLLHMIVAIAHKLGLVLKQSRSAY